MLGNFTKRIYNKIIREIPEAIDYFRFKRAASSYIRYMREFDFNDKSLLIVSGRGMNVVWAQIWSIYSIVFRVNGYKRYVVTSKNHKKLNRYYSLLGIKLIFFEDIDDNSYKNKYITITEEIENLESFENFRDFYYNEMPAGQIALSTYSRHHGTGNIRIDDQTVSNDVRDWVKLICKTFDQAKYVYKKYNIQALFFTEVFMEEYGAYYYAALDERLNVIRFAGTVRDNAIIVQHLNKENDRTHHASIAGLTWEEIKSAGFSSEIKLELAQNFQDRYGKKWHRSSRNHPDTLMMDVEAVKKQLGISEDRKVAIIFSHILYDTLFFFGTDLYESYADWLVNTVKIACENDSVDWIIKVHPSNIWRGELNTIFGGRYEEEKLIYEQIGELPNHVKIVGADTNINPLSWFQVGDYCITVRGTSGLEMATLGKTIITAGTGRYDHNGFTFDSESIEEYEHRLANINDLTALSEEQIQLAQLYAHALFVRKPFEMHCMNAQLKTGKKKMLSSDDIIYIPKSMKSGLPNDLNVFKDYSENLQMQDLLT